MSHDQQCSPDDVPGTVPQLRRGDFTDSTARERRREVRVLDFKDGRSSVRVAHGPGDPSRVWLMFENQDFAVHLSVEEGIGRELERALSDVMARFRTVRCTIDRGVTFR
jgi:hypothetical protein